jgi:hypothetical protein
MLSYHSNQAIKQSYIKTALEHERADSFVKGLYWQAEEKKGCNIGCWTRAENGDHPSLSLQMGVPVELLHLSDGLFEALPDPHYKKWSRKFAAAIPVGVDLGSIWVQCLKWMLVDDVWGLGALGASSQLSSSLDLLSRYLEQREVLGSDLNQALLDLKQMCTGWKHWDEQALRETRAARAALELWNARLNLGPKDLAKAAWSARAAWSAAEDYTLAQAEALLERLKSSGRIRAYSTA